MHTIFVFSYRCLIVNVEMQWFLLQGSTAYNSAVWKGHTGNDNVFCEEKPDIIIKLEDDTIGVLKCGTEATETKLDDIKQHHHLHQLNFAILKVLAFFDHIYYIYTTTVLHALSQTWSRNYCEETGSGAQSPYVYASLPLAIGYL